jgi:hypothetical protein
MMGTINESEKRCVRATGAMIVALHWLGYVLLALFVLGCVVLIPLTCLGCGGSCDLTLTTCYAPDGKTVESQVIDYHRTGDETVQHVALTQPDGLSLELDGVVGNGSTLAQIQWNGAGYIVTVAGRIIGQFIPAGGGIVPAAVPKQVVIPAGLAEPEGVYVLRRAN